MRDTDRRADLNLSVPEHVHGAPLSCSLERLVGGSMMTVVMVRRRFVTVGRGVRGVNGDGLRLYACLSLCLGGGDSFGSRHRTGGGRSRSGAEGDGKESGEAHCRERRFLVKECGWAKRSCSRKRMGDRKEKESLL